jgi:hypothetical protein
MPRTLLGDSPFVACRPKGPLLQAHLATKHPPTSASWRDWISNFFFLAASVPGCKVRPQFGGKGGFRKNETPKATPCPGTTHLEPHQDTPPSKPPCTRHGLQQPGTAKRGKRTALISWRLGKKEPTLGSRGCSAGSAGDFGVTCSAQLHPKFGDTLSNWAARFFFCEKARSHVSERKASPKKPPSTISCHQQRDPVDPEPSAAQFLPSLSPPSRTWMI